MTRISSTGHVYLEPGDACGLPPAEVTNVLWQLSDTEKHMVLSDIAIDHPEAFEEALLNLSRIRERIKAKRAARAAGTAPTGGAQ